MLGLQSKILLIHCFSLNIFNCSKDILVLKKCLCIQAISEYILSVSGKKFFPITFIGSIVWIAAYSYLMVWWANVSGDTIRIPPEVSTSCKCCTGISTIVISCVWFTGCKQLYCSNC